MPQIKTHIFSYAGDRNLTNGPLTTNRLLPLTTNSTPGWDDTMHNLIGNIAFADGSVYTFTIPQLRQATSNMVSSGSQFTNRLAFP
jgi:prepilin-type processing-associated H-X9-DG protein